MPRLAGVTMPMLSSAARRKARKKRPLFVDFMRASGAQLDEVTTRVEAGIIKPAIDRTFPFKSTARALSYVGQGRSKDQVIIDIR
ncbi:zinc-binding dehydrogenase [Pseudomonas sp. SIMBA_077]